MGSPGSAQAKNAVALVENRLRIELQEADRQQIPLFPDLDVLRDHPIPL